MPSSSSEQFFIGLMSGTSLDGVDAVLATFPSNGVGTPPVTASAAYLPFCASLRDELLALQIPGENELHREAVVANVLARRYAECVDLLLKNQGIEPHQVRAIGMHGQTLRHRPELGYTRQAGNAALLAELTGIDVVADFRSRDVAAGGQGAPLVPAFHQAVFGSSEESRVVANIGGIANMSVLRKDGIVAGFDTGPGNVLMDLWIQRHHATSYDQGGRWAASGAVHLPLLQKMVQEPYFHQPPPKSTGRDLFHEEWLHANLAGFETLLPADVQATLARLTAVTLVQSVVAHAPDAQTLFVCGGGAYNHHLMHELQQCFDEHSATTKVTTTEVLGIAANHVEALAFAWLAQCHVHRVAGNVPAVTGASGAKILGALFPA